MYKQSTLESLALAHDILVDKIHETEKTALEEPDTAILWERLKLADGLLLKVCSAIHAELPYEE